MYFFGFKLYNFYRVYGIFLFYIFLVNNIKIIFFMIKVKTIKIKIEGVGDVF